MSVAMRGISLSSNDVGEELRLRPETLIVAVFGGASARIALIGVTVDPVSANTSNARTTRR